MELQYANNIAIAMLSEDNLQAMLDTFAETYRRIGFRLNPSKTQFLYQSSPGQDLVSPYIKINGETLPNMEHFPYLGSHLSPKADIDAVIQHHFQSASASFRHLKPIVFDDPYICADAKILVHMAVILPTLLYGAETWTSAATTSRNWREQKTNLSQNLQLHGYHEYLPLWGQKIIMHEFKFYMPQDTNWTGLRTMAGATICELPIAVVVEVDSVQIWLDQVASLLLTATEDNAQPGRIEDRKIICLREEEVESGKVNAGKFGSLQNGNFLGLLELISQFDPFLAGHILKYGNSGKGNPSYLSKTTCEELIQLMAQKVHALIVDEVKSSGYFSLSVDSTPDLSHIDQLSVVLRYLKYGQPIERFLTFLEMKSHTGEEMANQVLQYLREACRLNFSKCRGQSYDNAANMSGRYKGMQQKFLETNKFVIYVPCAAHSLNLVGRSAVDCCQEAVNFFSTVQLLYTLISASSSRWKILKGCIGNESVLKSLSDTRWEAHAMATAAILKSFLKILEALECIAEDQSQKGDARREANNIADKMQELEFVFMLNFWNEILQNFHRVSQVLQNEDVNLKTCADLYVLLADKLCTSRDEFERYEAATKEMLPDVDCKAATTRKRIRKKVPNDGDAPEVYLNARDKFRITTFYTIVDKLETEMKRRGEIYKEIAERFSFLSDVPHNVTSSSTNIERYSQCCQKLIDAYPEDFNSNFSAELQQFHSYVRHKFSATKNVKTRFSHAELYKIIVEDNIECAFPNVDIGFRIFLTLMVTNCSAERSFSQLKYIKNPIRTTMQQGRLDALSLLSIEADVLHKISFEDLIKDFAIKKSRRKLFKYK
ncbi:zinc finger MYM-type protein 1-like [Scyliorhinus canicula]|uniref:zinc finger MYM-type protein 1-like n=1 Tax=Scyliorhinus canicula TaxID=7830 RepID=UPI0018F57841|nr:zinc finger MYM-type protein 1-like [Scyliorhinus canicula]